MIHFWPQAGQTRHLHSRAGPVIGFLFLVAALLPLCVKAVIFEPLSIQDLTRQADLVLQGTVLSKSCQRDPAGRLYTRIDLQVSDVFKGALSGSPFVIVHGGGILGDRQSTVAGQVEYNVGEEVVVFLVRNQRGEGVTLGLMQGKFHVWTDPATHAKFAASPFHGLPPAVAAVAPRTRSTGGADALRLSDLKRQVLEACR